MINLDCPYLPYSRIAEKAHAFLNQHNADLDIPVDIEKIIEYDLGLDIVPIPNLLRDFDIDGFTARNFSAIYVDDYVYSNREYRYRFTLAHEVGHLVLHKNILQKHAVSSVTDWIAFIDEVNPANYSTIETQGYIFGGLALVPPQHLKLHFKKHLSKIIPQVEQAKTNDLAREDYLGYAIDNISVILSPYFKTSTDVIERRIKFDKLENQIP
jgi:hypothetical protein